VTYPNRSCETSQGGTAWSEVCCRVQCYGNSSSQNRSKICLSSVMANNIHHLHILEVLLHLMIPADAELDDLDRCHIVPLADGTLATMKLINTNEAESPKYFVVSEEELKLFEFASRHLVKSSIGTMLEPVLRSGKFNLARLKLCDVRKLLEMKPSVSTPSAGEDRWLTEFWKYWNSNVDSSLPSSNIDTMTAMIFRGKLNGRPFYASPKAFHGLPAVVEPSIGEHQQLCDKIPGLWCFNPNFIPTSLTEEEGSFYSEASLYRFIHALRVLSGQGGIATFVKTHLDVANLKVTCSIVLKNLRQAQKAVKCLLTPEQSDPSKYHYTSSFKRNIEPRTRPLPGSRD
jgi:sacsin